MDDLVEHVSVKTGLSLDQARQAVQATLDYLKSRMPASLTTELELAAQDDGSLPPSAKGLLGLLDKLGPG